MIVFVEQMSDDDEEEQKPEIQRRVVKRRECAEIARKRLRLDIVGGGAGGSGARASSPFNDAAAVDSGSREGSCDRNSCTVADKHCSLGISAL